jgi:hypothetical protein
MGADCRTLTTALKFCTHLMPEVATLRLQTPASRSAYMKATAIACRLDVPCFTGENGQEGTLNTWTDFPIRASPPCIFPRSLQSIAKCLMESTTSRCISASTPHLKAVLVHQFENTSSCVAVGQRQANLAVTQSILPWSRPRYQYDLWMPETLVPLNLPERTHGSSSPL